MSKYLLFNKLFNSSYVKYLDKKRKKAEAAEAEKKETESGGALSEEEISLILQEQEIIENFDESTLQELVDILHPR